MKLKEEELKTIVYAYQQLSVISEHDRIRSLDGGADPAVLARMQKLSRKAEKALKPTTICPNCSHLFS
jgi:hypothetical protein